MGDLKLFIFVYRYDDDPDLVFAYTVEQAKDILKTTGTRLDTCSQIIEKEIPTEPTHYSLF